jgi:uncharacterized protein (TIGR00251 family)
MAKLRVRVVANAKETKIVGWQNEELVLRLSEPPIDGRANKALLSLLSKILNLSKSRLSIFRGTKSKHKIIDVLGLDIEEIKKNRQPTKAVKKLHKRRLVNSARGKRVTAENATQSQ